MRIALPVVVLLFGATSAHGQVQPSGSTVDFAAVPAAVEPVPAAASTPAAAPAAAPALASAPTGIEAPARAEAAVTAERAQPAQRRGPTRAVWFLLGAVAVLALILVAQ
jgi:hypothetical protein